MIARAGNAWPAAYYVFFGESDALQIFLPMDINFLAYINKFPYRMKIYFLTYEILRACL
jgi:hypothetical protein